MLSVLASLAIFPFHPSLLTEPGKFPAPFQPRQPAAFHQAQLTRESVPMDVLPPQEKIETQEVRPLPGSLDKVAVFNSNSPEIIQTEGILLSTFPPEGKLFRSAHLNYAFQGRFDIFSHHIARAQTARQARTLYLGFLMSNPSSQPVVVDVLQGSTYLARPEAQFIHLPASIDDPMGRIFSGPGSRVMNDVLRGQRHRALPPRTVIPPNQTVLFLNLPVPVGPNVPASNARSSLMRLNSSGPIHIASLALFAPIGPGRRERPPVLKEWEQLLAKGRLAGPRDMSPTNPLFRNPSRVIYGRVSGVTQGSRWDVKITDKPSGDTLMIPKPGRAYSYGISTLTRGTLGSQQVQSAPLLVRYPDTAYLSHGNYGVEYNLQLPLNNNTRRAATVMVSLQTPVKEEINTQFVRFFDPPEERIFFRGPLRISHDDGRGSKAVRYMHIVQKRGESGTPLLKLTLEPGETRTVQIDFLYPPDATPPQVVTVQTEEDKER
jgi:Protein of unknown function (DUF3370)